jgi:hypothetical protein
MLTRAAKALKGRWSGTHRKPWRAGRHGSRFQNGTVAAAAPPLFPRLSRVISKIAGFFILDRSFKLKRPRKVSDLRQSWREQATRLGAANAECRAKRQNFDGGRQVSSSIPVLDAAHISVFLVIYTSNRGWQPWCRESGRRPREVLGTREAADPRSENGTPRG